MRRTIRVLVLLAPALLVAAYALYYPYVFLLEQERGHLANEIGSVSLVLPLLAAADAWLLGLADTARRGLWGWFALALLVPYVGSAIYAFAGPRGPGDATAQAAGVGVRALAILALTCLLASLVIPATGLPNDPEADRRLLDVFGLALAVCAAGLGAVAAVRGGRHGWTGALLLLAAVGVLQLVLGASYPLPVAAPPENAPVTIGQPGLTQSFFGVAGDQPVGYLTTFGIALALALVALVYARLPGSPVLARQLAPSAAPPGNAPRRDEGAY